MWLILGQYADGVDAGVDAVGEREVDNSVLAAERNCRLCDLLCQYIESAALAAGQQHCNAFFLPRHFSAPIFHRIRGRESLPSDQTSLLPRAFPAGECRTAIYKNRTYVPFFTWISQLCCVFCGSSRAGTARSAGIHSAPRTAHSPASESARSSSGRSARRVRRTPRGRR